MQYRMVGIARNPRFVELRRIRPPLKYRQTGRLVDEWCDLQLTGCNTAERISE